MSDSSCGVARIGPAVRTKVRPRAGHLPRSSRRYPQRSAASIRAPIRHASGAAVSSSSKALPAHNATCTTEVVRLKGDNPFTSGRAGEEPLAIASRLIEHGLSSDWPAVVASESTLPDRRVVCDTPAGMAQAAAAAKWSSPRVTFGGQALPLREQFDWRAGGMPTPEAAAA